MRIFLTLGLVLVGLLGCAADGPQPQLPMTPLTIDTARGPVHFRVEVASSRQEHEIGLMFRKQMAADAGMLFDFHGPALVSFWMKNTILPLDLLFISNDGVISSIAEDATPFSTTPIPSAGPVRAVLEINAGRVRALGIASGDRVHHAIFGEHPSAPGALR